MFTKVFLLPLISVSVVIAFLQYNEMKTLFSPKHFVLPMDILTCAFARVDVKFWILRKLLMLLVAATTGASITVACG